MRHRTKFFDGQTNDALERGTPGRQMDFREVDWLGVLVDVRVRQDDAAFGVIVEGHDAGAADMPEVVAVRPRMAAERAGIAHILDHFEEVSDIEHEIVSQPDSRFFIAAER